MPFPLLRDHLATEFGGTSPYFYHLMHRLAYASGFYRLPKDTDFNKFTRLVFVCKGNICRSPYAEMRARQLGLNAISAGLDTTPGKEAYDKAIRISAGRDGDLSTHRTQRLSDLTLSTQDLILVMEPSQIKQTQLFLHTHLNPIGLIGEFTDPARPFLQDPYGRGDTYFGRCYDLIDEAVNQLAAICTSCYAPADSKLIPDAPTRDNKAP